MRSPRVGPWGPKVHGGGAARGAGRSSLFRAGSWTRFLLVVAAEGRRRPSTFALVGATGKRNVRRRRHGDVWGATSGGRVHMYGAWKWQGEKGPFGNVKMDPSVGWSSRRGRTERSDGSADRTMNPCPLDGTDQRARHVFAAGVEPDGPVDADGDQALVIDRCAPPDLPARWRGCTAVGCGNRGASATAATLPVLVAEARGPPLP